MVRAILSRLTLLALAFVVSTQIQAFCGFYLSQAGTSLFNDASKVVLVRDGNETTITMANDYVGEPEQFAMVVPVPQVPKRADIKLAKAESIDHLDAYTAPRLVEYFDPDPCRPQPEMRVMTMMAPSAAMEDAGALKRNKSLGVKIEAQYAVGEYDILILSAKQSQGLLTWLQQSGYAIPQQAVPILYDYIAKGMKFFVAKVNLARSAAQRANQGGKGTYLSPLQIRMTSPDLMLPIRLGTVNARGDQELFVFAITRSGRVEGANYPTVEIPSDQSIPPFVEKQFGRFYQDMFTRELDMTPVPAIYMEYAWDMSWCDPCAANPPSHEDLISLGATWLKPSSPQKPDRSGTGGSQGNGVQRTLIPTPFPVMPSPFGRAIDAFVTRLHMRYNAQTFPRDLLFRVTNNRENFQGRYILNHPFTGDVSCEAGQQYQAGLQVRQQQEAIRLSRMTGWSMSYIESQQKQHVPKTERKSN